MATANLQITVCLPWWINAYIAGLEMVCGITGYEPTENDVERWSDFIMNHAKVKVEK